MCLALTGYGGMALDVTRGGRDNDPHRPRRIDLRPRDARNGRERGSTRCQMQKLTALEFHGVPSLIPGQPHTIDRARRPSVGSNQISGFSPADGTNAAVNCKGLRQSLPATTGLPLHPAGPSPVKGGRPPSLTRITRHLIGPSPASMPENQGHGLDGAGCVRGRLFHPPRPSPAKGGI
jgi:hypothetical protein